jgi:hypothetical protein
MHQPSATHGQSSAHKAKAETPSLPVKHMSKDLGLGHHVGGTISSILVDTFDDESSLILVQEPGLVGEVDNQNKTKDAERDCDDAKEEEDPSPGVEHSRRLDEGETVTDDVGETRDGHREQVERCQTLQQKCSAAAHKSTHCFTHLLRLPTSVPSGDEEYTSGEETGFEETKDDSNGDKLLPVGDKGHSEHGSSPEDGDRSQQYTSSHFTQ